MSHAGAAAFDPDSSVEEIDPPPSHSHRTASATPAATKLVPAAAAASSGWITKKKLKPTADANAASFAPAAAAEPNSSRSAASFLASSAAASSVPAAAPVIAKPVADRATSALVDSRDRRIRKRTRSNSPPPPPPPPPPAVASTSVAAAAAAAAAKANGTHSDSSSATAAAVPPSVPSSSAAASASVTSADVKQSPPAPDLVRADSLSRSLIPCEWSGCNLMVHASEYDEHLALHRMAAQPFSPPPASTATKPATAASSSSSSNSAGGRSGGASSGGPPCRYFFETGHCKYAERCRYSHAYESLSNRPPSPKAIDSSSASAYSTGKGGLILAAEQNYVRGVVSAVRAAFSHRRDIRLYLCDEFDFYFKNWRDSGWGCGYRNVQTLLSSLLRHDCYRAKLRETVGMDSDSDNKSKSAAAAGGGGGTASTRDLYAVPSLPLLQRCLDAAHAKGYDPGFGYELGAVSDTKAWIGAVDNAALLRSVGVKAEVYNFLLPAALKGKGGGGGWRGRGRGRGSSSSSASSSIAASGGDKKEKDEHHALLQWVYEFYSAPGRDSGTATAAAPSAAASSSSAAAASGGGALLGGVSASGDRKQRTLNFRPVPVASASAASSSASSSSAAAKSAKPAAPTVAAGGSGKRKIRPPLYLQHSGHSRTIIGCVVNSKTSHIQLLVLDPDYRGGGEQLLKDLGSPATGVGDAGADDDDTPAAASAAGASAHPSSTAWRRITRSVKQLTASAFQILTVPEFGLYAHSETEQSKAVIPQSVALRTKPAKPA